MRASGKLSCLAAAALLAGSVATSTALGTVIVRDEFNHPDGSLVGNPPIIGGTWANHSGTAGQMQVAGGQAVVNHALSEDANTAFSTGAIGAGDTIYAGFDLTVPSQATDPGTVYFAHFKDAGNFFASRVFITAPAVSGNGYRLGISGNSTLLAAETFPTDLAFDTTYRVVHSYDYDTGATTMWINPTSQASPSVSAFDGFAGDEMQAYALRESTQNSMQLIDCLQVATTFDEARICIPEPSTVALMLLAVGLVGVRRRHGR
jgi:hypothetical protein